MGTKARYVTLFVLVALPWPTQAFAQQKITCPDKTQRVTIDLKQIQLQYNAASFAGTLASLGALSAHLSIEQKVLQQASVATQQWNEFLKGLVAGYNSCAITNQQYADSLKRIYPRLKEDAAALEEIRKVVSEGRKADDKRLEQLLDSYFANLRRFAEISGSNFIIERVTAVVEKETERVLQRLDALERKLRAELLVTPAEIREQVSPLRARLIAKVDAAEAAYEKGHTLFQENRCAEAIPYFQQALTNIEVPGFEFALGICYLQLRDFKSAEEIFRALLAGTAVQTDDNFNASIRIPLAWVSEKTSDFTPVQTDDNFNASINIALAWVSEKTGEFDEALSYAKRTLRLYEELYGPEHIYIAAVDWYISDILGIKGDGNGASDYKRRAQNILDKLYGREQFYAFRVGFDRIYINFPLGEVERAADKIIKETWGKSGDGKE